MSKSTEGVDCVVDIEVRMVILDHSEGVESLRNRVPAVQNAVIVNFDSRPYHYDAWTEVDGNLLRYPEQADQSRSTFQGTVGFSRAPTGARGRDHYDKIVYEDDARSQPVQLPVIRKINVGSNDGPGRRIHLSNEFIECVP